MTNPFPGMDPYLERHWGDVHHRFITYAADQLQLVLPRSLVARMDERVYLDSAPESGRRIIPDVRVFEQRHRKKARAKANGAVAFAEPLIIELDEPITEPFIEIRDRESGDRVITVIEVLSLSNKVPGAGQKKYLQKREELQQGEVSLVEIDLLRAGERLLPCALDRLPQSHRTAYQVIVQRGWKPTAVEVYAVPLRKRLPAIRVPLRATDADVTLDLQQLIEQCYRNGAYETIDYRKDPDPPLTGSDARWAAALLREKGLRKARR
jgi:hypothetical protein